MSSHQSEVKGPRSPQGCRTPSRSWHHSTSYTKTFCFFNRSFSQTAVALTHIQTCIVQLRQKLASYATPSSERGSITRLGVTKERKDSNDVENKKRQNKKQRSTGGYEEAKASAFTERGSSGPKWRQRLRSRAQESHASARLKGAKELWSFTRIWVSPPRWPSVYIREGLAMEPDDVRGQMKRRRREITKSNQLTKNSCLWVKIIPPQWDVLWVCLAPLIPMLPLTFITLFQELRCIIIPHPPEKIVIVTAWQTA